ncbi:MAG: hypothetical protein RBG13Loki_2913 [Promethearchaeota archaeon CR_4]|nr:MAG: hypothetical protein RBG13Loki_2913 [Candidatus Lokiarchaeota archaeon CR_4]
MNQGVSTRKLGVLLLFGILFGGILLTCISASHSQTLYTSQNPSIAADPLIDGKVIEVIRDITLSQYLLTEVSDTYSFENNGTTSLTKFIFCTDADYDAKLLLISASGVAGETYPIVKNSLLFNGYNAYEVEFLEALAPGDVQKIKITTTYFNLTFTSGTYTTQTCKFTFNLYPISPFEIDSYICVVTLPQGASGTNFSPEPSTTTENFATWKTSDVVAFSKLAVTADFSYTAAPILQMNSINRRIIIDPWGYLNVEEDHVLVNTGLLTVQSYSYKIPKNATEFQMWDDLGGIEGSVVTEEVNLDGKTKNVTINLNNNRAALLGGNQFKYTTFYRLVSSMHLSSSWNKYYLNIQIFTSQMDFLIITDTTQVILQTANTLDVKTISPSPNQILMQETKIITTYTSEMISPRHNRIVEISFEVNGFWMMLRPLILILIILVVISGYVFLRKVVHKKGPVELVDRVNIPTKALQEFVSAYEEKSALLRELDQLNEDLKMKKVAKKEHTKRLNNIQERKKETEEDLKPLTKTIAEADERFRKIIEKLQFCEAERISVEDSLTALENRYRRGAIPSRTAFQKLYSDFTKRLEKIQNDVDKLLNELKSYIY